MTIKGEVFTEEMLIEFIKEAMKVPPAAVDYSALLSDILEEDEV